MLLVIAYTRMIREINGVIHLMAGRMVENVDPELSRRGDAL